MQHQNYGELASAADAAAQKGLNYWKFLKAIKRGEVPAVKLPGGRIGVTLEAAEAYAEAVAK